MPLFDLHFTNSLNHTKICEISSSQKTCQKLLNPADLRCFVMISSREVSKRLIVDNEWNTLRVNSRRPVIRIDFRTWNLKYSSWENQFLINTFFLASYMHIETVNWSLSCRWWYCGGDSVPDHTRLSQFGISSS